MIFTAIKNCILVSTILCVIYFWTHTDQSETFLPVSAETPQKYPPSSKIPTPSIRLKTDEQKSPEIKNNVPKKLFLTNTLEDEIKILKTSADTNTAMETLPIIMNLYKKNGRQAELNQLIYQTIVYYQQSSDSDDLSKINSIASNALSMISESPDYSIQEKIDLYNALKLPNLPQSIYSMVGDFEHQLLEKCVIFSDFCYDKNYSEYSGESVRF